MLLHYFPQSFEKVVSLCSVVVMLSFKMFPNGWKTAHSPMHWHKCQAVYPTYFASHKSHWNKYTTHWVLTIGGLFSLTLRVCDSFLLVKPNLKNILEVTYSYHNGGMLFFFFQTSWLLVNFFVAVAKTLAKGKFVSSAPLFFLLWSLPRVNKSVYIDKFYLVTLDFLW